jgi:ribosomal protein L22
MGRASKIEGDLAAIATERARLQAKLRDLNDAEKRVQAAERDAGRAVLLAALGKVKIAAMDRKEAKAIAHAIEVMGASAVANVLTSVLANAQGGEGMRMSARFGVPVAS